MWLSGYSGPVPSPADLRSVPGSHVMCSSLLSIALMNSMTKSNLEEGVYPGQCSHSPSLRKFRARTRAGADTETMEGCCLLACSQLLFLGLPGPPTQGWHHPQSAVGSPTWKSPTDLPKDQSTREILSIKFLFPR